MNTKKRNVILYCRVSSDEQKLNTSLSHQEETLSEYCRKMGYNVVNIYKDDFSAKSRYLNRPKLKEAYEYCRKHKGEVDLLLFLRWDRFARHVGFAFDYKEKFEALGVEINSLESHIDFTGTEWATLLSLYCGVAHTEDEKISRRTKDGIRKSLKEGKYPQKAPIGYVNHRVSQNETYLMKDEKTAPIVEEVFREIAHGIEVTESIRKKYQHLLKRNNGGYRTSKMEETRSLSNKPISRSAFYRMLRNRVYIGEVCVPAYLDEPQQYIRALHEPIIDRQTFFRVQDILDGKNRNKSKVGKTDKPELFLRKYLVCPYCGHSITGGFSKGNGGKYAYYNCGYCHQVKSRADKANEAFVDFLDGFYPTEQAEKLYDLIVQDLTEQGTIKRNNTIKELKIKLEDIKHKLNDVEDKFLMNAISYEQYNRIYERYSKELREKEEELQTLTDPKMKQIEPKLSYSYSLINNMSAYVRHASVTVKRSVIGSIFSDKIEFDGNNYRTIKLNEVASLILQYNNDLTKQKRDMDCTMSHSVPRAGLEPAQPSLAKGF